MLVAWIILSASRVVSAQRCNIPKRPLTELEGQKTLPDEPVIYTAISERQHALQDLSSRKRLIEEYGDTEVVLSSSNTYSHGRYTSTLEQYITTSVDTSSRFANESHYLFGNNYEGIFKAMTDSYINPPCFYCDVAGAKTIGIGGHASGVSFHFHGPGFSESIIGSKRWFLFPPNLTKTVALFGPNMTVAQWVDRIYPLLMDVLDTPDMAITVESGAVHSRSFYAPTADGSSMDSTIKPSEIAFTESSIPSLSKATPSQDVGVHHGLGMMPMNGPEFRSLALALQECVIYPGEVLYFPPMWMHATLNLESYNVFMSLFMDPQLMK